MWVAVRPTRFIAARAPAIAATRASPVSSGITSVTRPIAPSRSSPVGRPSARQTISELSLKVRALSMPAAASAAGVARAVWKSKNVSTAGAPPTASANSSPLASRPSNTLYASEWPVIQEPSPQRRRSAASRWRTSSMLAAPARSAPWVSTAPRNGCEWLSTRPGTTASPPASISSVAVPHSSRTSASSPTPTIKPSRTATARASGRPGSRVRMRAFRIARSAGAGTASS